MTQLTIKLLIIFIFFSLFSIPVSAITTIEGATLDTYVLGPNPNGYYGMNPVIIIDDNTLGYIYFPISTDFINSTSNGTIDIYIPYITNSGIVNLSLLDANFDETTTWNTRPSSSILLDSIVVDSIGWTNFTIPQETMDNIITGAIVNYGFELSTTNTIIRVDFSTRESSDVSTLNYSASTIYDEYITDDFVYLNKSDGFNSLFDNILISKLYTSNIDNASVNITSYNDRKPYDNLPYDTSAYWHLDKSIIDSTSNFSLSAVPTGALRGNFTNNVSWGDDYGYHYWMFDSRSGRDNYINFTTDSFDSITNYAYGFNITIDSEYVITDYEAIGGKGNKLLTRVLSDGRLAGFYYNSDDYVSVASTNTFNDGAEHTVTIMKNSSNLSIWIDGTLEGIVQSDGDVSDTTEDDWNFGREGIWNLYKGAFDLDDIYVYKSIVTDNEILNIHNNRSHNLNNISFWKMYSPNEDSSGNSLKFNSSIGKGYVNLSQEDINGNVSNTIGFRIKFNDSVNISNEMYLASHGGVMLFGKTESGGFLPHWYNGSDYIGIASTTVPVVDTWYHVLSIKNATNVSTWVNGSMESSLSDGTTIVSFNDVFSIGGNSVWDLQNGSYEIDDVFRYNRELTQDEINAIVYSNEYNQSGLQWLVRADEGISNYTYINTPIVYDNGKYNEGVLLNGTTRYNIDSMPLNGTDDFTISMWVNFTSLPEYQVLANIGNDLSNTGYVLYMNYGTLYTANSGVTIESANDSIGVNDLHMVGVTVTEGNHQLYIDGMVTGNNTSSSLVIDSSKVCASIGATNNCTVDNGTAPFWGMYGIMDDVMIINGSLNATEMYNLYTIGVGNVKLSLDGMDITSDIWYEGQNPLDIPIDPSSHVVRGFDLTNLGYMGGVNVYNWSNSPFLLNLTIGKSPYLLQYVNETPIDEWKGWGIDNVDIVIESDKSIANATLFWGNTSMTSLAADEEYQMNERSNLSFNYSITNLIEGQHYYHVFVNFTDGSNDTMSTRWVGIEYDLSYTNPQHGLISFKRTDGSFRTSDSIPFSWTAGYEYYEPAVRIWDDFSDIQSGSSYALKSCYKVAEDVYYDDIASDCDGNTVLGTHGYVYTSQASPYLEEIKRYNNSSGYFYTAAGHDPPSGYTFSKSLGWGLKGCCLGQNNTLYFNNSRIKVGVSTEYGGAIVYLAEMDNLSYNYINNGFDAGRQAQSAYWASTADGEIYTHTVGGVQGWNPTQAGNQYNQPSSVTNYTITGNGSTTNVSLFINRLRNYEPNTLNGQWSDLSLTINYRFDGENPVIIAENTYTHYGNHSHGYLDVVQDLGVHTITDLTDLKYVNDTGTQTYSEKTGDWYVALAGDAIFGMLLNPSTDTGVGMWYEGRPQLAILDGYNYSTPAYRNHTDDINTYHITAMPAFGIAEFGTINDNEAYTGSRLYRFGVANETELTTYFTNLDYRVEFEAPTPINQTINTSNMTIQVNSVDSGRINNATLYVNDTINTTQYVMDIGLTNLTASYELVGLVNANYTYYVKSMSFDDVLHTTGTIWTNALITFTPPTPIIISMTTGDYWKNISFNSGVGNITDGFNVSRNGTWYNGTATYLNTTTVAHGWINDTIYSYNSTGTGALSISGISNNTQMDNNAISISGINDIYNLNEGDTLSIDANYSDADNDIGTFADNATEWNINTSTGEVSWITSDGDQGTYYYQINVSDGYGSTDEYNFTVIVEDNSPVITQYCNNVNGCGQTSLSTNINSTITFNVTINQTANISWSVAGSEEQNTTNTTFIREFLSAGSFNVTATGYNANGTSNTIYTIVNVGQLLATETAVNGIYTLNITHTPTTSPTWANYTTTNTILLNADFNNTHSFSTNNSNATTQVSLPHFNTSTGDVTIGEDSFYTTVINYFYPPASLTAIPEITYVHLNWTATPNADKYSIYELEEGIPWFNTQPTLDGIIDDIYLELSHHFHINSPNPVNTNDFDVLYMGRDATWVYLSGTAIDNDANTVDDRARLYTDFTKNGLTTDDLMYEIKENGATSRHSWSGSAWVPSGGSGVTGTTTGAGTNLITYELRVPVSELPANWINGTNVSMMLEREDTSLNPDVLSYYPFGNINATDTSLWQDIKLTNTTEYVFLANTTNISYNATGLIPYNWYRFAVSAWNGSQETTYSIVNVTTLDTPSYNISGYIIDNATGLGISNAQVWAVNGFTSARETTNATGYYSHGHFHNGTYRIFANATGYATNNTTAFTVAGANITNKNVTLIESVSDNLVNFTFTNLAYTTPIKEYQSTTITVDINDSDGTITNAIIKIHGSNHTMQYISGDQWRYIYSSGIITNHYITNIYATDNASGTNSTTYTTDYISILSRAGAGGGGGGMVLPPQIEEEEDVLEVVIPTNVSDAVDFVENVTKSITNIISGDSFSMLRINTNPFQPSYAKTIMISGVVDATSTDPNVDVGAVNNEVIVITRPPLDNSLYFKYDTSIDIALDTGAIEHRDYSVMVIDLMTYIPVKEMVMQNANPYIFKPSGVSSVEGVRMWWIVLMVLGVGGIVYRMRGNKK